jgi:hypothetical protein
MIRKNSGNVSRITLKKGSKKNRRCVDAAALEFAKGGNTARRTTLI